jgi:hypothetical protein
MPAGVIQPITHRHHRQEKEGEEEKEDVATTLTPVQAEILRTKVDECFVTTFK